MIKTCGQVILAIRKKKSTICKGKKSFTFKKKKLYQYLTYKREREMWENVVITICSHFILAIRKKKIIKKKKKENEMYVCGKKSSFILFLFFLKKKKFYQYLTNNVREKCGDGRKNCFFFYLAKFFLKLEILHI